MQFCTGVFGWCEKRGRVQIGVGEPFMTRGVAGRAGSVVAAVEY